MLLSVVVVVLSVLTDGCRAFEDWDQYEIVWRDEFDFMDLKNWQYEVTCSGGGVSIYLVYSILWKFTNYTNASVIVILHVDYMTLSICIILHFYSFLHYDSSFQIRDWIIRVNYKTLQCCFLPCRTMNFNCTRQIRRTASSKTERSSSSR